MTNNDKLLLKLTWLIVKVYLNQISNLNGASLFADSEQFTVFLQKFLGLPKNSTYTQKALHITSHLSIWKQSIE